MALCLAARSDDITNDDDKLGSRIITIRNRGGKCTGVFDRLRLNGYDGFADSYVSFEWEYGDPTPDAKMMWERVAFSRPHAFLEHNVTLVDTLVNRR